MIKALLLKHSLSVYRKQITKFLNAFAHGSTCQNAPVIGMAAILRVQISQQDCSLAPLFDTSYGGEYSAVSHAIPRIRKLMRESMRLGRIEQTAATHFWLVHFMCMSDKSLNGLGRKLWHAAQEGFDDAELWLFDQHHECCVRSDSNGVEDVQEAIDTLRFVPEQFQ